MLDNRVVQSLPISSLYFILLIFPCVVPTEQTGFNTRKTDAYSRGGEYTRELLVGVCFSVLQILTLFQTQICHFSHSFSAPKKLSLHYLFGSRLRVRTATKIFLKIHFEFAYFSLFFTHLKCRSKIILRKSSLSFICYLFQAFKKFCVPGKTHFGRHTLLGSDSALYAGYHRPLSSSSLKAERVI